MTPKERMARAMNLKKPDRVPVMCQMSIGHMLLQTGFSPSEFWLSADCFAEGLLKLREVYDFDGILISLHGHSPNWRKNVARIEKEETREIVYWKNGDITIFPSDDLPLPYPARRHSISEFDPDSLPETLDYIPVSPGLEFRFDQECPYDIFDIVKNKAGSRYSLHGEVTSPFDYFLNFFGLEQALMALIEEPEKCKEVLQRFTDGVKRIASGQARQKVDAIKISSPYAGAGFISPKFYQDFVLPYESQIVGSIRECSIPAYVHTCGAINDRLEMMLESGISGIECLDPPPIGDVHLEEAKKRVGDKIFIKGNIDPIHTLLFGSREAVEKDVKYRIAVGKPESGFILSSACSIAPHTPRENIQILIQVAEEIGYY